MIDATSFSIEFIEDTILWSVILYIHKEESNSCSDQEVLSK
jgi:hypothetical protein